MSRETLGIKSILYIVARIQKKSRLNAIRASSIHKTSAVEAGSQIVNSTMDRHSFCGYDCVILNASIGSFCSIADSVYVGGSHHPTHFVSTSPAFLSHRDSIKAKYSSHEYHHMPRTEIGHDVWIGYGAKIKAGVKLGHGAVVGMGSIVTKDVQPYSMVGGNPAREISKRFADHIISALLRSKWWDYDDKRLEEAAVQFHDPEKFLKDEGLL